MSKYLFLLIFLANTCFAQIKNGIYSEIGFAKEQLRTFSFNDGRFQLSMNEHMGVEKLGVGTFKVESGKLILNFEKYPNQESSTYSITEQPGNSGVAHISVVLRDSDNNSLGGRIGISDKDKKPLLSTMTDNKGEGFLAIYTSAPGTYFTISVLGYYAISIPIDKLFVKDSNIFAKLRPATKFYISPNTETYKIIQNKSNSLILLSSKNEKVVLKLN